MVFPYLPVFPMSLLIVVMFFSMTPTAFSAFSSTMAELEVDHSSQDTSVDSRGETSQDSKLEFSEDEETLITKMYKLVGQRWDLIAGRIPGRTAEEIEKYWTSRYSTNDERTILR